MKFREGDIVSVRGEVEYDYRPEDSKGVFIKVKGHYASIMLTPDKWGQAELKLIQPRFDVGEDVHWDTSDGTQVGTILALSNGHVWLDLGNGDYCTRMLSAINRIDRSDDDIPV